MFAPMHQTAAVELRQTIDEVVGTIFDAEVLREVDYAHFGRNFVAVLCQKWF